MDIRRIFVTFAAVFGGFAILFVAAGLTLAYTRNPISDRYREREWNSHCGLGNAAYSQRQYTVAADEFSEMVKIFPDRSDGYLLRGRAEMRAGQHRNAVQDFTECLRRTKAAAPQPGDSRADPRADILYNRGYANESMGKHTEAIGDFTEALRLNPAIADARPLRAEAYFHAKRYAECIDDCTIQLDVEPRRTFQTLQLRADSEDHLRQFDRALADGTRLTDYFPCYAQGWASRGWYEFETGAVWASVEHSTYALQLDGRLPDAWFNLGLAYAVMGDRARAAASYTGGFRLTGTERGGVTGVKPSEMRVAARQDVIDALKKYPKSKTLLTEALRWIDAGSTDGASPALQARGAASVSTVATAGG
jgi:tetratricopeptide (TPR) repeat protein